MPVPSAVPPKIYRLDPAQVGAARAAARRDGVDDLFFKVGADTYVAAGAGLPARPTGAAIALDGRAGQVIHYDPAVDTLAEFRAEREPEVRRETDRGRLNGAICGVLLFSGGLALGIMSGLAFGWLGAAGVLAIGLLGGSRFGERLASHEAAAEADERAAADLRAHDGDPTRVGRFGTAVAATITSPLS